MVGVGSGDENVPSYLLDGWYGVAAPHLNPLLLTYIHAYIAKQIFLRKAVVL